MEKQHVSWEEKKKMERGEEEEDGESPIPFIKSLLSASVPPGAESDFWPTMLSREQKGYENSDPGENCGKQHVSCDITVAGSGQQIRTRRSSILFLVRLKLSTKVGQITDRDYNHGDSHNS